MTQGQLEKEIVRQSLQAPVDFFDYQNTENDKLLNSLMSYRESFQGRDSSIWNRKRGKTGQQEQKYWATSQHIPTQVFNSFL